MIMKFDTGQVDPAAVTAAILTLHASAAGSGNNQFLVLGVPGVHAQSVVPGTCGPSHWGSGDRQGSSAPLHSGQANNIIAQPMVCSIRRSELVPVRCRPASTATVGFLRDLPLTPPKP